MHELLALGVAVASATAVWMALVRHLLARPPAPGATGRTIAVAVAVVPLYGLIAYAGVGATYLFGCSWEGLFRRAVDCSPKTLPVAIVWTTLCTGAAAVVLRAVYRSGGRDQRRVSR